MAYKRYVNKKGKRHGPYYYKNVRDESGKVKSIYLGKVTARGKRPLEVAIVFLAVLLIIISTLFFIQNRNLVLSQIAAEEAAVPFEVDQILMKVLVKANEFLEKELRVMNVGDEEQTIAVEAIGISDIVNVLDKEFTIKPGQTKIVRVNFSSLDRIKGIEQAPGVYIGKILAKTDSFQKEVPVVVEIESKNVLFDMNLNPVARDRRVVQGSSTTFEIRVFNLQSIDSFNVDMDFFVKDINGNTIISESESVVVKTQASFFKTLRVPEKLKTGNYIFVAQASLGNSVGTASYLFEVEEVAKEQRVARFIGFCRNDPLCWALSIIVLLLLFAIGAYGYFFIGAFIYQKLFGIRLPRKSAEEIAAEAQIAKEKKENPIISSFRNLSRRIRRSRDLRIKRKLEIEREKLKLEEEKEKLKIRLRGEGRKESRKRVFEIFHDLGLVKTEKEKRDIENRKLQLQAEKEKLRIEVQGEREKLKERQLREREKILEIKKKRKTEEEKREEGRKGLVGKCRKLIDIGYKALDKNDVRKADKIYTIVMNDYIKLSSDRKVEIFKEMNSFYKSLLLKKQQLKQKEEADKKKQEKIEKEGEAAKRKKQEGKLIDKERRAKLREERKKGRRKKVFNFFHGLGLVKTKKEKREIERQKAGERKGKELEKKRKLEQKRKRELENEKQRELDRKRKQEEKDRQREEEEERRLLEEQRQRELDKKRAEEERIKAEEEEREREKEKIAKREQAEEERRRAEEERKRELEDEMQRELERKRAEEERKKVEEEERERREEEKKQEKEERKRELEDEMQRREEEERLRELERERAEEERIGAEEEERKQLEIKKREEEKRKLEELELKRKEAGRREKQAQRENRLNKIKELEQGIKEKDIKISKIKEKIKDAYSERDSIVKDIPKIEKDIEGIKNEKKMLFKVYNEGIGSRKQLSEERKNRLAEWKQKYDAKLKEKSGIKEEIKQEYGNELKELENELQGLSNKDRKDQEKWKKLELKAKHKLEEHEREKGVNEDLKRILTEKRDIEEEFKEKRMGLGKGIEGRDIMQKQKELNDHIIEHEKDIDELNKDIKSKERSLDRYESNIEELEEEKNKAENALLDKKKELGGINYFASIFKFAVRTKPVKKQVESKERLIQKKDVKEKEGEKEIKQEEIEEQEADDEEAEKELQKSLIELGKVSKKIKQEDARKPGIIDRFFKHGKAEEAKVKPKHIEKEKAAYIEIKKKLKGKSGLFVKCHKLLLKADDALQNKNIHKAKKLYLITRDLYIRLEYHEKKEIYHELTALYNKLKK